MAEQLEVAESEVPTPADAQPVSEPDAQQTGREAADSLDDAYEAAYEQVTSKGQDDPKPATPAIRSAKGTTPAAAQDQPETQAQEFSEEESAILSRFKVQGKLIEALKTADPLERTAFIGGLKERHDQGNNLYREYTTLKGELEQLKKGGQPASTQSPQQTTAPATDEVWKSIEAEFGPDAAKALRSLNEQSVGAATAKLNEEINTLKQQTGSMQAVETMLYQLHREQGMADARKMLPEDVDLSETKKGQANAAKLMSEATKLLRANFNPESYNLRHALAQAAGLVFTNEIRLSERKKLASSQRRAVRGSGDPTGLPARSRPSATPDEIMDRILEAQADGRSRSELEAIASGR